MQLCKWVYFVQFSSTLNAPLQGKVFSHAGNTSLHLGRQPKVNAACLKVKTSLRAQNEEE